MNKLALIPFGLFSSLCLVSCSGDIDGFTESGGGSSSNIISAGNFSIGFSEPAPAVLTFSAPPASSTPACSTLTSISADPTSTITATAADKDNALVSSGTVYFEVQYGTLDNNSCELVKGKCSVEWSAVTNIDSLVSSTNADPSFDCFINSNGTVDILASVTAWTYGIEYFDDNNGDGNLSGTESFIDTDEPYLDRNDNNTFDIAIDNLTSSDTNGIHEGANGVYNGPYCDTTTRADCGGANLIPIYMKAFMGIGQ